MAALACSLSRTANILHDRPPAELADDYPVWRKKLSFQWRTEYAPRQLLHSKAKENINKQNRNASNASAGAHGTSTVTKIQEPKRMQVPESKYTSEYLEVRQSAKGGLGIFARHSIPSGIDIHAEAPLVVSNGGDDLLWWIEDTSQELRAKFLNLHSHKPLDENLIRCIFKTNQFRLNGCGGVFDVSSRFNHSCKPSCTYKWNTVKELLVFTTLRAIEAEEEITINYGQIPAVLYANYGFICDCGYCCPPTPAEIEHIRWEEQETKKRVEDEMRLQSWYGTSTMVSRERTNSLHKP